jgi:uncharacterized protein (TIGR00106 family)
VIQRYLAIKQLLSSYSGCDGDQPVFFVDKVNYFFTGKLLLSGSHYHNPWGKRGGNGMFVILDLSVVPLGVGVSVSRYVVACEEVISEAGLTSTLHANGTNIEGEWDEVMTAIKRCHERIHEMGAPRISTTIKLGTRIDRHQTMADKVQSVEEKMR